jgi:hypothetical protein
VKIHIIPSAYMVDDSVPNMIVSMKLYNQLMNSKEKFEVQFQGLTKDAEDNFRLIFEMYGIPYQEGKSYPLATEPTILFKKKDDQ